jgi:hypothetical protein
MFSLPAITLRRQDTRPAHAGENIGLSSHNFAFASLRDRTPATLRCGTTSQDDAGAEREPPR